MKIIPAIDLRGGRCVRLSQGNFDRETEYSTDPAGVAQDYASLGVSELHIVDLDGARGGVQENTALVRHIATESPLAVQLGGGIRERAKLVEWFDYGVARCVIGSTAITDPEETLAWLREFGVDRIVLALDVQMDDGTPQLRAHGWHTKTDVSLWDCITHYRSGGLKHVLCTDIARDGEMSGPNLELYADFVARCPDIELQASGGVRDVSDLQALRRLGAAAAITGRALLEGTLTTEEVRAFPRNA